VRAFAYVPGAIPEKPEGEVISTSNVRFDSGGQRAGKFKGTVFPDARIVFTLYKSDATVKAVALHLEDAFRHPAQMFPAGIKYMPGQGDRPLHRTWDQALIDDNRSEMKKVCLDIWTPYNGDLMNCDEYPMATTQEGASKANGNYSVRLIDKEENTKAGAVLQATYTLNRMLDGEPFYVEIAP
jgi:hypothetical protein